MPMNESELAELAREIECVDFREFWWGSRLLDRASRVRDPRIIRALLLRHHGLSNKKAFSAHVVRNAIKEAAGPHFECVWRHIDSEEDEAAIVDRMDDFDYLPWAATFVLGEVGGLHAFAGTVGRLSPAHRSRHFLLVRLMSHLVLRYLQIQQAEPPLSTVLDLNTGEAKQVPMTGDAYEMEMTKRRQADQLFLPIPRHLIQEATNGLRGIPESLFNYPKDDFLGALRMLPVRID